jgi:hypothetical protein
VIDSVERRGEATVLPADNPLFQSIGGALDNINASDTAIDKPLTELIGNMS